MVTGFVLGSVTAAVCFLSGALFSYMLRKNEKKINDNKRIINEWLGGGK